MARRASAGRAPGSRFVASAPAELIALRHRLDGKRAAILDRLLTDSRMRRPWREIDKRIEARKRKTPRVVAYHKLWGEIQTALIRSRRRLPSRAAERETWTAIADTASKLAGSIEGGLLDLPIFELYPSDDAGLVFGKGWAQLQSWERYQVANRVALQWPTVPEALQVLAARAKAHALAAVKPQSTPRFVERQRGDTQARYFVARLALYFQSTFDSSALEGSLAQLASVVLQKDIGVDFVKNSVRGVPKAG